ncbi:unnamed protein product [Penicillium salamii]|uniref:Uncharacterized protein n=1 Tax=Penicillium salamii TaxID=1612424 RepID=A0A9W4NYR1_9EURO|nr:unnamed protein product [Penicillium salamii]
MGLSQSPSDVSSSFEPPAEFPPIEHEFEDPLAQVAKETKQQQPFTTYVDVRNSLEHLREALDQNEICDQYLVFTSVPPVQHFRLSDDRSRTSKSCRFSYNAKTQVLVAKITPNLVHFAIGLFDDLIFRRRLAIDILDDVCSFGSATVTIGDWKKEADRCWAPDFRNFRLSFVLEVGFSESARRLALDAHDWLEAHDSSVRLVVTISIRRQIPEIVLQRWEVVTQGRVLARSSPCSARCTAFFNLSRQNDVTIVTGKSCTDDTITAISQLGLSFEKIIGRPPHQPLENDLTITEGELQKFAERIWKAQGFL